MPVLRKMTWGNVVATMKNFLLSLSEKNPCQISKMETNTETLVKSGKQERGV